MPQILPYLLCSALYAVVAVLLGRTVSRPERATFPGARALHLGTALPLTLHAILLARSVFADGQMYLGVGNSISVIVWLTVLIYWVSGFFHRLESLQIVIAGAAAAFVLSPLALPSVHPLSHTDLPAFRLHLIISLMAYSLFMIASLQALIMALLEKRLHGGPLPAFLQSMPPLLTMEQLLFRIIATGFLLLTLTLGSGMLFSEEVFGQPLRFTHKVVLGIVAWCIYAALLAGRQMYGWRGRRAVGWTLSGFAALLLAYIGSKFVIEVILHR